MYIAHGSGIQHYYRGNASLQCHPIGVRAKLGLQEGLHAAVQGEARRRPFRGYEGPSTGTS